MATKSDAFLMSVEIKMKFKSDVADSAIVWSPCCEYHQVHKASLELECSVCITHTHPAPKLKGLS